MSLRNLRSAARSTPVSPRPLLLVAVTCLLGFILPQAIAEPPAAPTYPPPATDIRYVFGLSPFLDSGSKDRIFRQLVRFILEVAPRGTTVQAIDAYHIQTISTFEIPRVEAFASPKTRATQFRDPIQAIRRFLATESQPPTARGLNFTNAVRLPQLLDFVSRNLASSNRSVVVSLFGSPLYQDDKEPGFSMAHGYFPSDGHLLASRDTSVFGLQGRDHALDGVRVHWAYLGDPWASELHRDKVSRFWALYVERQGGQLGAFTGDLPTAFGALRETNPTASSAAALPPIDPTQTKVEMLRVTRDVRAVDWIAQDELRHPAQDPPSRTVGPLKIGIRWKSDIDLDLYATPAPDQERLYFEHPRSPQGYYEKDHRSSPGRDYEFIEFVDAVDVHTVQAAINFYEGRTTEPPQGEIRVEFEGRVYSSPFTLDAIQGNRGREGAAQSRYWLTLDIPRMLKLRGNVAARALHP